MSCESKTTIDDVEGEVVVASFGTPVSSMDDTLAGLKLKQVC